MFNKFPYTDFHEMNCDEIIRILKEGREVLNHVVEQTTILDSKVANIDHKITEIEEKVNEGIERIELIIEEAEGVKEEMNAIYEQVVEAGNRAEENARYVEDVLSDVTPAVTASSAKSYLFLLDIGAINYDRYMFDNVASYFNIPTNKYYTSFDSYSFSGSKKWESFGYATFSQRNFTDVVLIGGLSDYETEPLNDNVVATKNAIKNAFPHSDITYVWAYKANNAFNTIAKLYDLCVSNGIYFTDVSYSLTDVAGWHTMDAGRINGSNWSSRALKALSNEFNSPCASFSQHLGLNLKTVNGFGVRAPSYTYDYLVNLDVSKEYTHLLFNELNLNPSGAITMNQRFGILCKDTSSWKPRFACTLTRFYVRIALQNWGDLTGTYDGYITLNGKYIEFNMQGVPGVPTGETPIPKDNSGSFITIYPATTALPTNYTYTSTGNE